jgi:chromosome partitioning protein
VALRADHMDALACGLGVTEHDPRGKAAAEIRDLLEWVLGRLKRGAARLEAVPAPEVLRA